LDEATWKRKHAIRAAEAYKKRAADAEELGTAAIKKAAEQRKEILDELKVFNKCAC